MTIGFLIGMFLIANDHFAGMNICSGDFCPGDNGEL